VIGEEPHLAYNRVGLTSFFENGRVEELYLNPKEWVGIASKSTLKRTETDMASSIRHLKRTP
jgi:nitrite reductase (NAD(P)H)